MDPLDTAISQKLKQRLRVFKGYGSLIDVYKPLYTPPSPETIHQQNEAIKQKLTTDWANQFTPEQREIIRKGLYQELNVALYADPKFNSYVMKQMYKTLESHKNIKTYQTFINQTTSIKALNRVLL